MSGRGDVSDDHVAEESHTHKSGRLFQCLRSPSIGGAGLGIAAWVVVSDSECATVVAEDSI